MERLAVQAMRPVERRAPRTSPCHPSNHNGGPEGPPLPSFGRCGLGSLAATEEAEADEREPERCEACRLRNRNLLRRGAAIAADGAGSGQRLGKRRVVGEFDGTDAGGEV